jgi:hypothetical protein
MFLLTTKLLIFTNEVTKPQLPTVCTVAGRGHLAKRQLLKPSQLAIHFQTFHPKCKVLLFSGQAATADLLIDARLRGYKFELLSKPVHPSDLIARLQAL